MKQLVVDSVGRLDVVVWLMVITFFCMSAILFSGDLNLSFIGASGIIIEMLLIGLSIEIIIEALKNVRGIGTLTGFITNGPEALCLIVGLAVGDVLYAASTPLGSNFMNPILLIVATLVTGLFIQTFKTNRKYTLITIILTAGIALSFYFLPKDYYIVWLVVAIIVTSVLFVKRPPESELEEIEKEDTIVKKWMIIPAFLVLLVAGYFLDSVVSFTADNSHAPKGVIGFFVLATLTSWPEFKSSLTLLGKNKKLAAILNITVSNITNIWLAVAGIITYLLSQ